jgi:NAD(P)H-hydrate epimerase
VTVALPEELAAVVTSVQPCAMTLPLPPSESGTLRADAAKPILEFLSGCDALVLGPGLGRNPDTEELVHRILVERECPAIVDADGLNCLSIRMDTLREAKAPTILTPHPGEMKRLDPNADPVTGHGRERPAVALSRRFGCVVLLKGHQTVVTDGRRVFFNPTGNPGMATGGTGDVLSGVIGALLGQKLDPFDAAVLGAYLHGFAGDHGAHEFGEVGLVATDLIRFLPLAFRRHHGGYKKT